MTSLLTSLSIPFNKENTDGSSDRNISNVRIPDTETEDNIMDYEESRSDEVNAIQIEEYIKCMICNNTFKNKKHLNDHNRNIHDQKEVPHVCPYCDKSFNKKSNLNRHVKLYCPKNPSITGPERE